MKKARYKCNVVVVLCSAVVPHYKITVLISVEDLQSVIKLAYLVVGERSKIARGQLQWWLVPGAA